MIVRSFSIGENSMQIETINASIFITYNKRNPKTGASAVMNSTEIKKIISEVIRSYYEQDPLDVEILKEL